MGEEREARERSLELIRGAHAFPGPYEVRVVLHPGAEAEALRAICGATAPRDPIGATRTRPSRTGRYLSVAVTLHLHSAEEVLEVYAALRTVEGVITVL